MRKLLIVLFLLLVIALPVCAMTISTPAYNTKETYNEHISLAKERWPEAFPRDFVEWDHIAFFGELNQFNMSNLDQYSYLFDDARTDYAFWVDVYHHPDQIQSLQECHGKLAVPVSAGMTSMLKAPERDEDFLIVRNGVTYCYYASGDLHSILLRHDSVELQFNVWSNYPEEGKPTFISMLLSTNPLVSGIAAARLTWALHFSTVQTILIIALIIVEALAIAYLLYGKRLVQRKNRQRVNDAPLC